MTSQGASFLPRIESVFYAVFDLLQGPKIVYQVPEGLIATSSSGPAASNATLSPSIAAPTPFTPVKRDGSASSSFLLSSSHRSPLHSSPRGFTASSKTLFNFDDISKYVIPQSALCGRLVICATSKHRVIGFPVQLKGNYERNYFRYNLCFVFERTADLSCYEPVVRKVSRVLTSCEEESRFLSSPKSSPTVHAILEQLFEDLNSYSETSIPIDKFNSIELKIFPFYPNPPPVKDWMVPLALINIAKRRAPNWDLTMVKVCQYIDGTNHVSRIARLAECDIVLTRQAISHLLYYQVIMMIDIFQYSNVYTLRKSMQWLADEHHVRDECGPYTTRPGHEIADWPTLLHFYSRFKPGKSVLEWMEEYGVLSHGIDVRRFTSFGVIKGFLRRVHRWPIILSSTKALAPQPEECTASEDVFASEKRWDGIATNGLANANAPIWQDNKPDTINSSTDAAGNGSHRISAAETSLEDLCNRDMRKTGAVPRKAAPDRVLGESTRHMESRTLSSLAEPLRRRGPRVSPDVSGIMDPIDSENSSGGRSSNLGLSHLSVARSPSAPVVSQVSVHAPPAYPPDLLSLLDGEHHTDELCTRFEVGWPLLEQWLVVAGEGKGGGDFGRVVILYR